MTTFNQGLFLNVTDISHQIDVDIRWNIKKPVLFPRFQGVVGIDDVSCSYVGTKDIRPSTNISIVNLEDSIRENSRAIYEGVSEFRGGSWYTSSKYFLLTDVVGDYISSISQPFFWKHTLPSNDIEPTSVRILDQDLNEVDENSYRVIRVEARDSSDQIIAGSYESISVFSNYKNSFDFETGISNLYFVRYEVIDESHYEILNQESAFTEATFDDISSVTGDLKPWRRVYIISPGVIYYSLALPDSSLDYYIKPLERSRIFVTGPSEDDDTQPWFVNVASGSFSIIRNTEPFSYSIPEFNSQVFSPLQPYKIMVSEKAQYVRPDIIKVNKTPLQISTSLYEMRILISNAEGSLLYAYTTNPSIDGDYYYSGSSRVVRNIGDNKTFVQWESDGIASYDTQNGFIQLARDFPSSYQFEVTYYYTEENLEFTSVNVNPIFDEDYDGHFYVVYIVPTGGLNPILGSQNSSVHYLKVDRSGRIVGASQGLSSGNLDLVSEYEIDGESSYYLRTATASTSGINLVGSNQIVVDDTSDFPARGILVWTDSGGRKVAGYSSKTDTSFTLTSQTLTSVIAVGVEINLYSFKELFTTSGIATNRYQWLILAEVSFGPTFRVNELSLIDTRIKGGVIKDSLMQDAMKIDPRAIWAQSLAFGNASQPIPGNTAAVVKIPYSLLTEFGGTFTQSQIEEIVRSRHLATGTVPVIIYYGAIPEITSISSTTSTVTVCWDSEGETYRYNVYYSTSSNGPWIVSNSTPLDDLVYGNCHTITGLTSGLIYYVVVTSVDEEDIESPESIPWGIRTRVS